MEGLIQTIQHWWCCYLPTLKTIMIPGLGLLGTIQIYKYKIKEILK